MHIKFLKSIAKIYNVLYSDYRKRLSKTFSNKNVANGNRKEGSNIERSNPYGIHERHRSGMWGVGCYGK